MLSHIHLQNFKKFQDVEIELSSPFTVLMGENNSGKTTILQAIHLVLQGLCDIYYNPRPRPGPSSLVRQQTFYSIDKLPAMNVTKVEDIYYGGKERSEAIIELTDSFHDIANVFHTITYHTSVFSPN